MKIPYARPREILTRVGNVSDTMKLAIQLAITPMESAAARILFGNISPSKTHTIGPHVAAKNATYVFNAMTAIQPAGAQH